MYGRASLLHWVHVLERVRMRASFWDSILVYFGWEYESPIRFGEKGKWFFFSISRSLLYPSSHLFWMWLLSMLWCGLIITHFSISLSSFIFVLFLHFTLPHLFFSFLILLDVWFGFNIHTLFLFIWYVIHLLSLFVWGSLGPRLMMFSTHCISCIRGMGIISLGLLSLVSFHFFSFLSPYCFNLRYVPCLKTTLRPWLHIVLDNSRMGNAWDWLEIISWSMLNEEL